MAYEGSKQEILPRIAKTVGTFSTLKIILKDKNMALMIRSLVISIVLYACNMDPCSRVKEEDTSYRNEMLPKTSGHLLQRSCNKRRSEEHY